MKKHLVTLVLLLVLSVTISARLNAQTTFTRVTQILQSNCTASSCHGSTGTQVFDLSGSEQDLYDAIVGVSAQNATAASKGHKLVASGYPARSFLLRKIANGISPELAIDSSEGSACPKSAATLSNVEIELVRQWIMFGAPQTDTVVSEQTIIDFYNGKALPEIEAPPAPPAGQGFQVHDGPIFLKPGQEREYQWKFQTETNAVEVNRVEAFLSPQSHHYIVYKYEPGLGSNVVEGHRRIDDITDQFDAFANATMIATWQYNRNHELPAGTAYYWEAGANLISNFHVRNYDNDSILAAHVYMNVYTQPQGSGATEMFSQLAVYGGFNPTALNIPNSGVNEVKSFTQYADESKWYIWILQAHTHKLAIDYDIFLKNSDGTKGTKIYEGWYNYDNNYNSGSYDYAHPPVREFSPLLEANMDNGLLHEATYFNDGPAPVGFGLTTADEMFITYMHYTKAAPTGIKDVKNSPEALSVYPNPIDEQFTVNYQLADAGKVKIELFDVMGARIALLKDETQSKGAYHESFDASALNLPKGICFIKLSTDNNTSIGKVVVE